MRLIKIGINTLKRYGIAELIYKTFFHCVNEINNVISVGKVKKAKLEYGLSRGDNRQEKVIVSLTSYPPRFAKIGLCLKSLLLQDIKPNRIIVYLGSDSKEADLTDEMRAMRQYGIEYRFDTERNLKPHKKYYYAMQEFPNDVIVTADDDIIYPHNWLGKLILSYKKYPNAISAWRVHKIEFDEKGDVKPYREWRSQYRRITTPSRELCATGGGGAVYPPYLLNKTAFDDTVFMEICPYADDLWLKCMEIISGIPVVWVKSYAVGAPAVDKEQTDALNVHNVAGGMNDRQLKAIMERYHINSSEFKDK